MSSSQNKKRFINFHPYLFSLFSVLSLYTYNKDLLSPAHAFWPTILVLSFTTAVYLFIRHFIQNPEKAALLSSILLFTFFSFGHCIKLPFLSFLPMFDGNLNYSIGLIIWLLFILICTISITKSRKNFWRISSYLNTVSLILVVISTANIIFYEIRSKDISELITKTNSSIVASPEETYPDIYYIVLDGFARQDVLKEIYNVDNSSFISSLEDLDFFVASQSTANYPQTYLSISSALNLQYLDDIALTMGKESTDRGPLQKILNDNQVYETLKKNGYSFVSFPYTWTGTANNQHTDIFMQNQIGFGEFGDLLLDLTPVSILLQKNLQSDQHRNKILHVFEKMGEVAKIKKPTFTYTHILAPHPPFVFLSDGSPTKIGGRMYGNDGSHYFELHPDKEEYRNLYAEQTSFIAQKTLKMVEEILTNSAEKPIIILQSDHGPGSMLEWEDEKTTNMKERFSILNAYYFPDTEKTSLYETITPVNSFRVIFNNIFDANFELLPDKNYFARWSTPYHHIDVTERVQ